MMLQWFLSRTVRHASALCKHVEKLLNHQRDVLNPKAIEEVEAAIQKVHDAVAGKADKAALENEIQSLEAVANKCIKPYPNSVWRENIEVLLVALAVAMGIRTFFLQPFKIPTGSMQPTLFGVTADNLANKPDSKRPAGLERVKEWFQGVSYIHKVAGEDGVFEGAEEPIRFLIFNIYQRLHFAGKTYPLWLPPDYGSLTLAQRAGIQYGQSFHKGEDIVNIRVRAGDHLFVDRLTYNFRQPSRGEIIVFETKGIPQERRENHPYWNIPPDQFYIKRLVGLGGETLQIADDRHLVVDGRRLDSSTPHFENVYSFDPKTAPRDSQYSGHLNQKVSGQMVPLFQDGSTVYRVDNDSLVVMGDNTMNSLDSRFWGEFPATSVIGRACFVYWPVTGRFGASCIAH